MRSYNRLRLEEREKIYLLINQNNNYSQIAKILGRNKSTISRELRRSTGSELGYMPDRAHSDYVKKLSRNKALFRESFLKNFVIDKLVNSRWSPEQISGRLKREKLGYYACCETIYKFIYSAEGIKLKLPSYLKQRRKKRGFRKSRKFGKSRIPAFIEHISQQDTLYSIFSCT